MNFITILNHLQSIAQKAITIQVRGHTAHIHRLRVTASPLRIRLIILTPISTAAVRRLSTQAIQDMETRPHDLVRSMAITSRPDLHTNPEMKTTGRGIIGHGTTTRTTTRTGGILTTVRTRTARGP